MISKRVTILLIILSISTAFCLTVEPVSAEQPGEQPPEFNLTDAITGKNVRLSDYEGKIVLLDFFATWCGPCCYAIDETLVPLWNQYYAEDPNIVFLSIDIWEGDATAQDLQNFAEDHGMEWSVLMGSGTGIDEDYSIEGVPTILIIDQDGLVTYRNSPRFQTIKNEIDSLVDFQYSLSVSREPLNGGSVMFAPEPAGGAYDEGTEVMVTAKPVKGYEFDKWSGDCPEGQEFDNPIKVTMDSDKSLTAYFTKTEEKPEGGGLLIISIAIIIGIVVVGIIVFLAGGIRIRVEKASDSIRGR